MALRVWHLEDDTPRTPRRVSADERVRLRIGTWPIGPGQAVRVVVGSDRQDTAEVDATWERNDGENSYWVAALGPFEDGERVDYRVHATGPSSAASSSTPYFHPILPLLIDTDDATVDRPGSTLPPRFARPEDAEEQVSRAVGDADERTGSRTRGMWPAEGAVSESSIELYARHRIEWIATDRGVLARSGRWRYDADDPDVLCRPYVAMSGDARVAILFRDTGLSDAIGFELQSFDDPEHAVDRMMHEIRVRFVERFDHDEDRLLTIALDGENAWGGYVDDGRPFLHALYDRLENSRSIATVTPAEYLDGDDERGIRAHPPRTRVHRLATASWIDEFGSGRGNDLGTWIGEAAENRAWQHLRAAREAIDAVSDPERSEALECVYAAEGSDWFWWYGDDQTSGNDESFDRLFREHLGGVYDRLGLSRPGPLEAAITRGSAVWTFANPLQNVSPGDRLVIRTNCPGHVEWRADDGPERSVSSRPVGGVLAGARRFEARLGEIAPDVDRVRFRFVCGHPSCRRLDLCCGGQEQTIDVVG